MYRASQGAITLSETGSDSRVSAFEPTRSCLSVTNLVVARTAVIARSSACLAPMLTGALTWLRPRCDFISWSAKRRLSKTLRQDPTDDLPLEITIWCLNVSATVSRCSKQGGRPTAPHLPALRPNPLPKCTLSGLPMRLRHTRSRDCQVPTGLAPKVETAHIDSPLAIRRPHSRHRFSVKQPDGPRQVGVRNSPGTLSGSKPITNTSQTTSPPPVLTER